MWCRWVQERPAVFSVFFRSKAQNASPGLPVYSQWMLLSERSRRAWWQRKWMQVSWSASMRFGWRVCWLHWGPLVCAPLFRPSGLLTSIKMVASLGRSWCEAPAGSRFSDGCVDHFRWCVSRSKMTFTKFRMRPHHSGCISWRSPEGPPCDVTHCHGVVFLWLRSLQVMEELDVSRTGRISYTEFLAGVRGTRMGNRNHLGPESCLDHLRLRSRICDKEVLKRETGSWNWRGNSWGSQPTKRSGWLKLLKDKSKENGGILNNSCGFCGFWVWVFVLQAEVWAWPAWDGEDWKHPGAAGAASVLLVLLVMATARLPWRPGA